MFSSEEAHLQRMMDTLPGVVYQYALQEDGSQTFTYVSVRSQDLLELAPETLLQNASALWDLVHPDDLLQTQQHMQATAQTLLPWTSDFRITTPSGVAKWLRASCQADTQPDSSILWNGILLDISDIKQKEAKHQQTEAYLSAILDNTTASIVSLCLFDNGTWTYEYCSAGTEQVLGYSAQEFVDNPGFWASRVFAEDVNNAIDKAYTAVLEKGIATVEYRFHHKDGSLRWLSDTLTARRDDTTDCWRVTSVAIDITTCKQVEQELYQAKIALEDLNQELEHQVHHRTQELEHSQLILQQSEEYFRRIFYDAPIGLAINRLEDNRFVQINAVYCDMMGYSEADLASKTFVDITHPEDQEHDLDKLNQLLNGEISHFQMEKRYIKKDGTYLWAKLTVSILRDPQGHPIYTLGMVEDITRSKHAETERQHAELLLAQQQQTLRSIIDNAPIWIWLSDLDGKAQLVNKTVTDDIGIPEAAFLAANRYTDLLDANTAEVCMASEVACLASETPIQGTETLVLADGKTHTLEIIKAKLKNEMGEVVGLIGLAQDVTERMQAEAALRESEERLRIALEAAGMGAWDWNLLTGEQFWSTQTSAMYGLDLEITHGDLDSFLTLVHPDDRPLLEQATEIALQTGHLHSEFRLIRQNDHSIRWIAEWGKAFYDETGKPMRMTGVDLDITERKLLEIALKHSEAKLNDVLNTAIAAVSSHRVYADRSWETEYRSAGWQKIFGYSVEEMAAETDLWRSRVFPEDLKNVISPRLCDIFDEQTTTVEYRFWHQDNSLRWISSTSFSRRDDAANCWIVTSVETDITALKQAQNELQAQREFLRQVIDIVPSIIFAKDPEGRYLIANQAIAELCQSSVEEMIGKTRTEIHPETSLAWHEACQAENEEVMRSRQVLVKPSEIISNSNGEDRCYQVTIKPFVDAMGQVQGVVGNAVDITERQQSAIALQQSMKRFRDLVEATSDWVWEVDEQGIYTYASPKVFDILGYLPEEVVGKRFLDLVQTEASQQAAETLEAIATTQAPFSSFETIQIHKNGNSVVIDVSGVPICEGGHFKGYRGISRDITERKQAEEQLRQMNEELAIANVELARATSLKDEFLANMSHELRTPLNAILGLSEVLQEEVFGSLSDKQRQFLATIYSSGKHLLSLINDLLDVAKIEAGRLDLQIACVPIQNLCAASLSFVEPQAHQKRIHLSFQTIDALGDVVVDERRMRQVLINLLSNAVKFTPEGGTVTLEVVGNLATGTLKFSVIDTGIGIAPEDLSELFQPFVQVDSSFSRGYEGTGLGLVLVKQLIELHGGEISAESEVGKGSRFTVLLPWAGREANWGNRTLAANSREPAPLVCPALPSSTHTDVALPAHFSVSQPLILIAEDNPESAAPLKEYLQAKGFRILLAENGVEAVQFAQTHQPQIILMDVQMPKMDGLEAIRQIRDNPKTAAIPVIAVTALAMPGDREACLAAGANDYFTKPLSLKQLLRTIESIRNP